MSTENLTSDTTVVGGSGGPQPIKSPVDEKVSPVDSTHQTSDQATKDGGDPSSKIWGLYLSLAERIDKEHSESWTANIDGVLVFTGLFAGVVATFLIASYPLLQPPSNPNDTTNQLLTQIFRQLSPNGTASSQVLAPDTSSFKPPASAVRVNALWFTSLAFSTACALWATLMQQWTRRYVQVADGPYPPPKRAQIRAFFSDGVEKFALAAAVEVLPGLLHTSVLLFYIGLIDFLININHTVGFIMLAWVAVAVLTYFILSMLPLVFPNSPYQTPLSSFCWFVMEAAPFLWLWLSKGNESAKKRWTKIKDGMRRALESKARAPDVKALQETLRSLEEDHKSEEFLDGIPGLFENHKNAYRHSMVFRGKLEESVEPVADKLFATCTAAGLLPEGLRSQRLKACLRAIWCFSGTMDRHFGAIQKQWDEGHRVEIDSWEPLPTEGHKVENDPWGPLSTETWAVALNIPTDSDPFMKLRIALRAHCVQALMAVMWTEGKWKCAPHEATELLQRQLGASSDDINRWHASGNQLQLAVAANLLSNSLTLLHELDELEIDVTIATASLKVDLKAILDRIWGELDASHVPPELQARFARDAKVREAFERATFYPNGPWRKLFYPAD